jgi:hypothetical protein
LSRLIEKGFVREEPTQESIANYLNLAQISNSSITSEKRSKSIDERSS